MPRLGDPRPPSETEKKESRRALEETVLELTELSKYLREIVDSAADDELGGLDDIYDGELWNAVQETGGVISGIKGLIDRRRREKAEEKRNAVPGTN
jgi:hypothetical protein